MISYKTLDLEKDVSQRKGKSKYIIDGNIYFAEEAAIKYYEDLGYDALWAENDYWWTLMSLLFWDIIFARVKGAVTEISNGMEMPLDPSDPNFNDAFEFIIKMNGMPHDFFTPNFYQTRKYLIDNKYLELRNTDLKQEIIESYNRNYGKYCRPIENWDKFSLEQLLIPINKLDNEKFLKILYRLIYNFDQLFFSEVKSENDRVSNKQKGWHSFLSEELGINVDLFLINHTNNKIKRLKKSYKPGSKIVTVSFGYSTSKNREKAIKFIQKQDNFFTKGKDKEKIYGAKFEIRDIEKLYTILDLTSRWKTQKLEVDGKIVKSTELRNSLWCYRRKTKNNASLDYCKQKEYENTPNKFGCKEINFHQLENDRWQISDENFGYVDTVSGKWIFNNENINLHIEKEIERINYCPVLNKREVLNLVKKVPNFIDPKKDDEWAFISNNYELWFWHEDKWLSNFNNSKFPGYNSMIGVERNFKEKLNVIRSFKVQNSNQLNQITPSNYKNIKKSPKIYKNHQIHKKKKNDQNSKGYQKNKKSGCFIVSAIYGKQSYQVNVLKSFRDNSLSCIFLGRLFIWIYYQISPHLVTPIKKHEKISYILKIIIDKIVNFIEKEY